MEAHYKAKLTKEQSKGICRKFGQWISRLFILVVVIYLVAPQVTQFYEEQIATFSDASTATGGKAQKGKRRQAGAPRNAEQATRMAQEREEREQEAAKKKEAEFDAMYKKTQAADESADEYEIKLEEAEELGQKYNPVDDL